MTAGGATARAAAAAALAVVVCAAAAGCAGQDTGAGGGTILGSDGGSDAGASACVPSGATADAGSIPPTFATVKLVLGGGGAIMPCASAPCHATGGMEPPGNPLTLQDTPALYATMTSYVAKECDNTPLVVPGHPEQSALVKILSGPCGSAPRMPYKCSDDSCIPADYIAALSQWIADCAPEQ
jgi:hypothetical protein